MLVVSPRRATLRGITQRLADVRLQGLAVAPRTLRRDIVRAIARNERAAQPQLADVDEALVRLRNSDVLIPPPICTGMPTVSMMR